MPDRKKKPPAKDGFNARIEGKPNNNSDNTPE